MQHNTNKPSSAVISISLGAIYAKGKKKKANQTYLLLSKLVEIITPLFEQETALFIQLKETMSERRINSLLTAASTIWLNRHPY